MTPAVYPLTQLAIMEILPEDKAHALKLLEQLIATAIVNSDTSDLDASLANITKYYLEHKV